MKNVRPSVNSDVAIGMIYTTNAIESMNSVIRKAIKNRKIFLNYNSACKIIYWAIMSASRRWSMPFKKWKPATNRFTIEFEGRFHVQEKWQLHRDPAVDIWFQDEADFEGSQWNKKCNKIRVSENEDHLRMNVNDLSKNRIIFCNRDISFR